jgi:serine/threonine-protein kinase
MLLTLAGIGTALFFRMPATSGSAAAAPVPTGHVSIDSRPQGADVMISGVLRGKTPLKLPLPTGQHSMQLNFGGVTRTLPLDIQAGTIVSQYVEFATEAPVTTGRLDIGSDPTGAQVRVDGTPRGSTPLSIASIAPGEHTIVISSGDTIVTRRVTVAAGATATVVASVTGSRAAGGYVSFTAPFALQVFEKGELLGTTEADRLMLPAGRHELELVNASLEFRRPVTVQIAAGTSVSVPVAVPNGVISINAQPWADVSLNGRPLGTTPLANVSVPVGSHELVFRHPQMGERKRSVTVTASTPVRIGMDLRQ